MRLDDYFIISNASGQVVFTTDIRAEAFDWAERQVRERRFQQLGVYAREGVVEGQVTVRWVA